MPLNISGSIVNATIADTFDYKSIVTRGLASHLDADSLDSYPGKDTVYDLSGNNKNGTMYNGVALSFDGSNDWVSFVNYSHPTACTLMCWVKTSNDGTICSHSSGGPVNMVYKIGSNKLSYDYYDGGWKNVLSTGTVVNDGNWHHIVFARSGTNHKFYVDGALDADTTMDSSMSGTIDAVGRRWSGNYFNGLMADFRLYGTQLSATDISEIYNSPTTVLPGSITSSQIRYWTPFTEGSGTIAYDGSGNNRHGTLTNGPTWTGGQTDIPQLAGKGQSNKMVFDGTNDYLQFGTANLPTGNTNVSLSCWVWPTVSEDSGCFGYGSATSDTVFEIYMYNDSGTLKPAVHYAGGNGGYNLGLTLKGWNHIVATYDQTSSRTYVNGALSVTDAQALTIATTYRHIGAHSYGSAGGFFDGLIDECAIWNSTLDAAAVTAIYNSGVPIDLRNNSSNYDEYTDNLVGYWRNEGKGRWIDLSGSENNASENGSPVQVSFPQGTTSERDSQGFPSEISSFIFNETNYISVGDLGTKTNWTISVWWNKFNRDENNIFYMGEAAGFSVWSANIMALYVYKSSSYTHTSTIYTWDTNRWYFLTINHDGSSNTVKIYINGSLIDTDSIDDHAYHEDFTDVKIGDGGYGKWDGKIGNFMIYDRVLSPTEILHNFNVQRDRFGV